MSEKVYKALRTMQSNWKKNEPRVLKQFARAGVTPDPALVFVFSVYYDTLKKLAKE